MKRTLVSVVVLAMIAITLSGCTAPPALKLTEADSGSTQTLAPDQELVITLESNPTTGYKWERDGDVPEPLIGEAPEYAANSDAIGGGGTETWRFRADSKGQGTLKLKYWRSFEPTVAPIKTFSVNVKVEE